MCIMPPDILVVIAEATPLEKESWENWSFVCREKRMDTIWLKYPWKLRISLDKIVVTVGKSKLGVIRNKHMIVEAYLAQAYKFYVHRTSEILPLTTYNAFKTKLHSKLTHFLTWSFLKRF